MHMILIKQILLKYINIFNCNYDLLVESSLTFFKLYFNVYILTVVLNLRMIELMWLFQV